MKKTLSFASYITIGSMLFGLFFGAGNLIFPVQMGQLAGSNTPLATLGFILTGVGLPFLGVLAIGFSQSNGLYDLAKRVHPAFGLFFTVALYLTIGPFFALPRTATVSFEVGIAPYISETWQTLCLLLFSLTFFILAWAFSLKPAKIMTWIGKILNPLFLIFLSFLIIKAFSQPMGKIANQVVSPAYVESPLITGFIEGYNTMDVLASLAFAIIVINSIKRLGVTNPLEIAKDTLKAGTVTLILMTVIYGSLAYMGATSLSRLPIAENGGLALNQIANFYFGPIGSLLLAIIVTLACLKTAIGLITACSETFTELFPLISYRNFVHLFSLFGCLIANLGLTSIIKFSLPVLMFLYPLSIVLVFLALLSPLFKHQPIVYQITIGVTFVLSIYEGLKAGPSWLQQLPLIKPIITFLDTLLPLSDLNMGWVLPAILAFIVSFILMIFTKKNISPSL